MWGVGWGQAKEPASQCAHACRNYSLANCPLLFLADRSGSLRWDHSRGGEQVCCAVSRQQTDFTKACFHLSGALNRLNAILSLLHPRDCYRTPSSIESAIVRPYLALLRIRMQLEVLNRLVLNCLGGSTARQWCYSVRTLFKNKSKKSRDRGRDCRPPPRP